MHSKSVSTGRASFHHVGLAVADLDRSTTWYESVLGFRLDFPVEIPDPSVRANMLVNDASVRLELFQLASSFEIPDRPDPIAALAHGYGHLALEVDDLERRFGEIATAGATIVWEPKPAPVPGLLFAFIADPDGNLIELIGPAR